MNDTQITLIGNATSVELRFTSGGRAACNFRLASTPRRFDKNSNQWVDGETLWLNCTVWGEQGENLVETVGDAKSLRVIVQGKLKQRSYETREGEKRTVYEVEADEVGPSLKYATAKVTRTQRDGGQQGQSSQGQQRPQQGYGQQAPQSDPWGSAPQGGGFGDQSQDAPF